MDVFITMFHSLSPAHLWTYSKLFTDSLICLSALSLATLPSIYLPLACTLMFTLKHLILFISFFFSSLSFYHFFDWHPHFHSSSSIPPYPLSLFPLFSLIPLSTLFSVLTFPLPFPFPALLPFHSNAFLLNPPSLFPFFFPYLSTTFLLQ